MKNIAFVFPGQAAQYIGMGKEAYEQNQSAKQIFERADEALGFSISKICFEGPEEKLRLTSNTQPAILTVTCATLEWVKAETDLEPLFLAGHSLGEYAALVHAGALSFEDAVKITHARGTYMCDAEGTMAAVIGMDLEPLGAICEEVTKSGYVVDLANQNSPGQIVISGSHEGVRIAGEKADAAGAKRVIPLNVSGPFHSSFMRPAAEKLKRKLESDIQISSASIPIIANTTAKPITEPADIFKALVDQVASPVLWSDSIRYMIDHGVDTFIEIGPGTVISGLIRKIDRSVKTYAIEDMETLNNFKAVLV
ncbi:[acyl-carrier-protein] S-malonyltransferase [Ammoniphilus oxalaticus]|uniref:Malonyl CoA-acyl carrier protein transacylase n=1 Tax=Ammoniphilus oxalaticus TaxID=66863 RepID=A0A419SJK4_9BACL|nr:ACP S-malonyltransferase [Ammoniphilus oxalaticus]RKD24167.1 [acyl-carrier-protein] S-malonyltransferase [Ammoniphilus oxalaticus]